MKLNIKLTATTLAFFIALGAGCAAGGNDKDKNSTQSDPVMDSLHHGVDHLDSVDATSGGLQRRGERYQVQNSDVMDLQFEFTPDFNQTVTVQPDGFIALKEIGDVEVQGSTVPEIKAKVEKAYSTILAKPVVTIFLRDFNKPYFLAFGQVARPGKYDLRGNTTVSAAVAEAGGFTGQAKHSQVILFRRVNDNWSSATKIDLKRMLNSRNLSEDLELRPGDMVYVPQNLISKVKAFVPNPSMGTYMPLP
jgi:polysaccharide export outer membrane protein